MTLKAISLWQPYASLVAAGIKRNETRSRPIHFRGLIALHAALHRDKQAAALYDGICSDPDYSDIIMATETLPSEFENLPFGAIVGVAEVFSCFMTDAINPSKFERLLGDYSRGRFAWPMRNARTLVKPIPWKGKQGFFEVEIPDSLL